MAKKTPGKLDIRSIESHLEQSSKRTNEPPIGFGGRPPNAKAFFVNREIAASGDKAVPKPNFVLPKSPKPPLKSPKAQSPPIQSPQIQSPAQSPQTKSAPTTTPKPKSNVKAPEIKTQKEEPVKVKKERQKPVQNEALKTINAPPKRTIPQAASLFEGNEDDNKVHDQEEDVMELSKKEHNGGNLYEVTILPSETTESDPVSPPETTEPGSTSPSEMSPDTTKEYDSDEEESIYDNIMDLTAHLKQALPHDDSDEEGIKDKAISQPENKSDE